MVRAAVGGTARRWWDRGATILYQRLFIEKLNNVSCEYDRLNGGNSTLEAAWYVHEFFIYDILVSVKYTHDMVANC